MVYGFMYILMQQSLAALYLLLDPFYFVVLSLGSSDVGSNCTMLYVIDSVERRLRSNFYVVILRVERVLDIHGMMFALCYARCAE